MKILDCLFISIFHQKEPKTCQIEEQQQQLQEQQQQQ